MVNELDLTNQLTSIHSACRTDLDPVNCYLTQVLNKFIQSQPPETCNKTVEKIVIALEELGNHYEATELRRLFITGELCMHVPWSNKVEKPFEYVTVLR